MKNNKEHITEDCEGYIDVLDVLEDYHLEILTNDNIQEIASKICKSYATEELLQNVNYLMIMLGVGFAFGSALTFMVM